MRRRTGSSLTSLATLTGNGQQAAKLIQTMPINWPRPMHIYITRSYPPHDNVVVISCFDKSINYSVALWK